MVLLSSCQAHLALISTTRQVIVSSPVPEMAVAGNGAESIQVVSLGVEGLCYALLFYVY